MTMKNNKLFQQKRNAIILLGSMPFLLFAFQNCGGFKQSFQESYSSDSGGLDGGAGAGAKICTPASLSPRRVWMLSRPEFDNSIAAVVGDTSNQAQLNFPAENRGNGFVSNADGMVAGSGNINTIVTAAETIAAAQAAKIVTGLGCTLAAAPTASPADPCATQFITKYATAFFRRPLTSTESTDLYSIYLTGFQNPYPNVTAKNSGVQLVLASLIQSPQFLYRTELGADTDSSSTPALTPYELVSAISYTLTGAPPDATLMGLADSGQISTPSVLEAQIRRLIASPAGHDRVGQFFMEILGADIITALGSSAGPLTPAIASDMSNETKKYVENAVFSGSGMLSEVLSSNYTFANTELASYYGLSTTNTTTNFSKVAVDPSQRGGILSQGAFLASTAKSAVAILRRGKTIRSKLLCQSLPTFASLGLGGFTPPPLTPPPVGTTTRQALEMAIPKGTSCFTCHQHFMPLGFGLDNLDPNGLYRTLDNGGNVDPTGEISMAAGIDPATGMILTPATYTSTPFANYRQLADMLAQSRNVNACFTKHIATFATGRADVANNDCGVTSLQAQFAFTGLNVVEGFVKFATSSQFLNRQR